MSFTLSSLFIISSSRWYYCLKHTSGQAYASIRGASLRRRFDDDATTLVVSITLLAYPLIHALYATLPPGIDLLSVPCVDR